MKPFEFRTGEPQRPVVVLLHSSGGSARQWRPLAERLAPRFDVRALDFHGHGARAPWAGNRPLSLVDEAALIAPILGEARVHLVGHSYGGAVALKIATMWPARVASVAVYEPLLRREVTGAARLRRLPMPMLFLSGAGHLGPITDAARANDAIVQFIERSEAGQRDREAALRAAA